MTTTDKTSQWVCYNCGSKNDYRETFCASCQNARYAQRSEPGRVRGRPPVYQIPGFFGTIFWAASCLCGVSVIASPALQQTVGVHAALGGLQALLSISAFLSSLLEFVWAFRFERIDIHAPDTIKAREEFEVDVNLVPYQTIQNVSVAIDLEDRYFEQNANGQWTAGRRNRDGHMMASKETLHGGRPACFACRFKAPMPSFQHQNLSMEMQASLLRLVGWLVPGVSQLAKNMKEHGGFFVRVRIGIGLFHRNIHRRIVTY